ncbi:MAG: hypothetical protein AAFR59_09725 [Bacteroidota bacterium]
MDKASFVLSRYLLLVILFLFSGGEVGKSWAQDRHYIQIRDSLHFSSEAGGVWVQYQPIDTFYEPPPRTFFSIGYVKRKVFSQPHFAIQAQELGVQYWLSIPASSSVPDTLWVNPNKVPFHIYRVRQDNSYLGLLSEMLGVPFVLGPMKFPSGKHMTDEGLGVDCAELAIYAKRRQGYNIPYVGPRGIVSYLDPIGKEALFEGCIIHFGTQVSVLYKDLPPEGRLNAEDILIQSFEAHVRKISWRHSGFYRWPFQAYMWEKDLPIRPQHE